MSKVDAMIRGVNINILFALHIKCIGAEAEKGDWIYTNLIISLCCFCTKSNKLNYFNFISGTG